MVLQVYADDSTTENDNFVLAGYIATAEEWQKFSIEWSPLARQWGTLQKDGNYVFKMSDMAWNPERMQRVAAFYRVIESHSLAAFSFGINKRSFKRALGRITVKDHDLSRSNLSNVYYLLFNFLVSNLTRLVDAHSDTFPPDEAIDFYFDAQGERKMILGAWDAFVLKSSEAFQKRLASPPRFETDTDFMPIQAADFWAWWSSHWMDTGKPGFEGVFEIHKPFMSAHHFVSEDEAVRTLKRVIWSQLPTATIYEHRLAGGASR